jgi:hypothetical protein
MGLSRHARPALSCDDTEAAARRLARVLWNDPATDVMRHADAGYEDAIACARARVAAAGDFGVGPASARHPPAGRNGRRPRDSGARGCTLLSLIN